jgi:hypothetical protein
MSELGLYENLMLLGSGIEACLDSGLHLPALVLLYSAIDTTGWLDSPTSEATRDSFTKWVDDYLLKAKALGCTSLELYGARCGLLHTFSPDSRLSLERKARRFCYAWGTASAQEMQRAIDLTNKSTELVAVHVNDLYEGWRLALLAFTEEVENDPERKSRVCTRAEKFFAEVGLEVVREALARLNKGDSA